MQRPLRRLIGIAATTVALLVGVGVASGADVGANDDTGKYAADGGAVFYQRMQELGLKQTVITVRWTPSSGQELTESDSLDVTVPAAQSAGLKVVLAVYPYPPREIESGLAKPAAFAAWLDRLARRYPTVKQFVVGNEPNQPAFFRPQFSKRGKQVSAARFGPFLAAGYDALKAIDPAITVIGVGLSPRGNDRPKAKSNVSTSPIRFLAALGTWYRASKRSRPLMDGFSFHPYPNQATDPLERGYTWPNAGFVNLDRVKQALWDAFGGTSQPTTVDGLRLYLDEVGWQVDTNGLSGYTGAENVKVTTDDRQSAIYTKLVERAACDTDIAEVNVFGFYDDPVRTGFQAALHRADGSPRPAAEALRSVLSGDSCYLPPGGWKPVSAVVGAQEPKLTESGDDLTIELGAAEGAHFVACVLPGRPSDSVIRATLARATAKTPGCVAGTTVPMKNAQLVLRRPIGAAVVAARLSASTNPRRFSVVSRPIS